MSTLQVNTIENEAGTIVIPTNTLSTQPDTQPTTDWNGVDYVDPLAIGTNPTAKIYPDGSIVGSTDNGSYTRYPNGDLECRFLDSSLKITSSTDGSIFWTTDGTYTFPLVFSIAPSIAPSMAPAGGAVWAGRASSTTSVCVIRPHGASNTAQGYLGYIAKGRWK